MKTLYIYRYFLMLLAIAVLGFVSCTKEQETEIVPRTTEDYKLQMSGFVASEKLKTETCVIGYDKGNFKVSSTSNFNTYKTAYLTVLNAADTVLNKTNVIIAEIVAANKTLATPGKNFNGSLFISDRRPLVDPIVAAEALNSSTPVGTNSGQVSQDAKTAYASAITAAKSARDSNATIDRQVQDAVKILEKATTTFNAAIIK